MTAEKLVSSRAGKAYSYYQSIISNSQEGSKYSAKNFIFLTVSCCRDAPGVLSRVGCVSRKLRFPLTKPGNYHRNGEINVGGWMPRFHLHTIVKFSQ